MADIVRRRRDIFDEMRRIFEGAMAEPFFRESFRGSGKFLPVVREFMLPLVSLMLIWLRRTRRLYLL